MVGLDPAPDLDRVIHAPELVDVAHQVDVGADGVAHDADALDRRRDRRLASALHLHLLEAHVPQPRARLGEIVDRMWAQQSAARVRRHAVAQTAEQGAHGLTLGLAADVPARRVDRRERKREDPTGAELPAARLSLATMASVRVGSSPTMSPASTSTASLSAGVSAPPKNVRPTPTSPWSVPSSRVTNSRVSVGTGKPTTSGLSAGVRSTRVVTWVIFMDAPALRQEVSDHDVRVRRDERRNRRLRT